MFNPRLQASLGVAWSRCERNALHAKEVLCIATPSSAERGRAWCTDGSSFLHSQHVVDIHCGWGCGNAINSIQIWKKADRCLSKSICILIPVQLHEQSVCNTALDVEGNVRY